MNCFLVINNCINEVPCVSCEFSYMQLILGFILYFLKNLTQSKTLPQDSTSRHVLLLFQLGKVGGAGKHQDIRQIHDPLEDGHRLLDAQSLGRLQYLHLSLKINNITYKFSRINNLFTLKLTIYFFIQNFFNTCNSNSTDIWHT